MGANIMRWVCILGMIWVITSLGGRADILVQTDWITLGDITKIEGEAAQRPIAAAPAPGQKLPLSADFIAAQFIMAGLEPPDFTSDILWIIRSDSMDRSKTLSRPGPPDSLPVLVRNITRGDVVLAENLQWKPLDARRVRQGYIDNFDAVIGLEARRSVRAGRPLRSSDFRTPPMIRKGESVRLYYQHGGIKLSADAKALNDAAMGEDVRLVNLQSNRTLQAKTIGPQQARIFAPTS